MMHQCRASVPRFPIRLFPHAHCESTHIRKFSTPAHDTSEVEGENNSSPFRRRSVLSAHTSVQKWDRKGLAGHPEVMKLSKQICEKASVSLAKLEEHHPDVFAELSTQQAAHLLLTEVVHEAEKLQTLGQLSKNETEFIVTRLKNQIFFLKDVDVEATVAVRPLNLDLSYTYTHTYTYTFTQA